MGGLWSTEGSEIPPSKTWVRVCDEELHNSQEWYSGITHGDTREDSWHLPIALSWVALSDERKRRKVSKNVGENLVSCVQESLLLKADKMVLYLINSSRKVNVETLWIDRTYWTLHVKKLLGFQAEGAALEINWWPKAEELLAGLGEGLNEKIWPNFVSCHGSWGLDKSAVWAGPRPSPPLCYGDLCYRPETRLTSLSWTSPMLEKQDFRYFRILVAWESSHQSAVLKAPAGGCLRHLSVEQEWSRDDHRFRKSPVRVLSLVLLSPLAFKAPSVCVTNACFPNEVPPHTLSSPPSRLNSHLHGLQRGK